MICPHPECTGVHDNNRFAELCPSALDRKRAKDDRYYSTGKGFRNRARKATSILGRLTNLSVAEAIESGKLDRMVAEAQASGDVAGYLMKDFMSEVLKPLDPGLIARATELGPEGRAKEIGQEDAACNPYRVAMRQ
jgi:hypothetical protein